MRLAKYADGDARYLWLSQADGPYPELFSPLHFLKPEFVARWIDIIHEVPDLGRLESVDALAPSMNCQRFSDSVRAGRRYYCDSMSELVRFMDESPVKVEREVRDLADALELSPRLEAMLGQARDTVAKAGQGAPVAIHVRRGDILDGMPWSYTSWNSKYVPDEFFQAFIRLHDGPVIAFSDTPAAITHLAKGNPRVIPVSSLLNTKDLTVGERDLLELLLMAGCEQVGAPHSSAFSRAAAVVGKCKIVPLPAALPGAQRQEAYDALLARVISAPDSFFAPGDQAQSASYAAAHAINIGRGRDLVAAMEDRHELLERFPFLYRELATAALSAGRPHRARSLAKAGLANDMLRNRDRGHCQQVVMVTEASTGKAQRKGTDLEAQLLTMLFSGRNGDGPIVPSLARTLLLQGGRAGRALMFAPELVATLSEPASAQNRMDLSGSGGDSEVLPVWLPRLDWDELLNEQSVRKELRVWPELTQKQRVIGAPFAEVERIFERGEVPPPATSLQMQQLGLSASSLRLHGRFRRAFAILHWLNGQFPDEALICKRLADTCFAAENRTAGWRWLHAAQERQPDNVLLDLSMALRFAQDGNEDGAAFHLEKARGLWPDLVLVQIVQRTIRKQGMELRQIKQRARAYSNQRRTMA